MTTKKCYLLTLSKRKNPPLRYGKGGFLTLKAGERIRTVDIHVGNVTLYH